MGKDPLGVFTIVTDGGAPAVRISGQNWGALTTRDEFENYHFRVEVKWGTRKWPPRETQVRDSGLLYHGNGPHGAVGGNWMESFQCQIKEGEFGDFYGVGPVVADVEGALKDPENKKGPVLFKKGGETHAVGAGLPSGNRAVRNPDTEKPAGEWNVMEILCVGGTSLHVVNGKVTMILRNCRHRVDGKEAPLTKGRIQFQSEAFELFLRKMEIRPLKEIPKEHLQ